MRLVGRLRTSNTVSISSNAVSIAIALSVYFNFIWLANRKRIIASTFAIKGNQTGSSRSVIKLTVRASRALSFDHLKVIIADTLLKILSVYTILGANRFTDFGRVHYITVTTAANTESSSIAIFRANFKTLSLKIFVTIIT